MMLFRVSQYLGNYTNLFMFTKKVLIVNVLFFLFSRIDRIKLCYVIFFIFVFCYVVG